MQNQQPVDLKTTTLTELESYAYKQVCAINREQKTLQIIEQEIALRNINPILSPTTGTAPIESAVAEVITQEDVIA